MRFLLCGGDEENRTPDPLLARQVLSQLSYTPTKWDFQPSWIFNCSKISNESSKPNNIMIESTYKVRCLHFIASPVLHRKEVIQPHLPIRLPCYDFTLITSFTFDCVLLAVRLQASGPPGSHGVTGGVYKARERIHRGMLIRDY